MKNKLKETMTTNEKQDEELKVLRAQNKDCATVIKEKVYFFSFVNYHKNRQIRRTSL